jgi:F-type H+-transporting ATPase subunit b
METIHEAVDAELGPAAVHAAEHGGGVFPPFDGATFASQIFWLLVTFGILYYLMVRVIVPRIGAILEERSDRIVGDLAEAEQLKEASRQVIATYERELADARRQAQVIAEERRAEVNAEITAKRTATETALSARLAEAEQRIAGITRDALAGVDTIAAEAAQAVVARLAAVTPDADEAAAAVRSAKREG